MFKFKIGKVTIQLLPPKITMEYLIMKLKSKLECVCRYAQE